MTSITFTSQSAVLMVDLINEIVDPNGKLAGKGYAAFEAQHGVLSNVAALLTQARAAAVPVIHVGLAFSPDYVEQPKASPLFGAAKQYGALQSGTWATEFHPLATPLAGEVVLTKHRVSAFYGTPLDMVLRTMGITALYIGGCATDVGVQSTVRDAHDRDYACTVLSNCCIAANEEDHVQTLRLLSKLATVSQA